jgi:hypothetical protein
LFQLVAGVQLLARGGRWNLWSSFGAAFLAFSSSRSSRKETAGASIIRHVSFADLELEVMAWSAPPLVMETWRRRTNMSFSVLF